MYECIVYYDYVSCTCYCYKYNVFCKYRLFVINKEGILKEYIDFLFKFLYRVKSVKSYLVEFEKNVVGKKGGIYKNFWRLNIRYISSIFLVEDV